MSYKNQKVKVINKFKDSTVYLLDNMFPSKEHGVLKAWPQHGITPVEARHFIIYGSAGAGKSETGNSLAGIAIQKYGKDNVNSIVSRGNFMAAIEAIDEKPVQFIYFDDFTGLKMKTNEIQSFHNRRHICTDKSKLDYGLIVSIVGTHRLTGAAGLPIALHTQYQILWKENVGNPWDAQRAASLIGIEGMEFLGEIEKLRQTDPSYKSHLLYRIGTGIAEIGRAKIEMVKEKYLTEVTNEIIPNIIKLTPKSCVKCGKMFEPRKSNHKVCFSCYLQTAAINGRYS